MNQREKSLQFKNSVPDDSNNFINYQNQRDKIKAKIVDKYGVSLEEAERIIFELEKKSNNNISNNSVSNKSRIDLNVNRIPEKGFSNNSNIDKYNSLNTQNSKQFFKKNDDGSMSAPQPILNRKIDSNIKKSSPKSFRNKTPRKVDNSQYSENSNKKNTVSNKSKMNYQKQIKLASNKQVNNQKDHKNLLNEKKSDINNFNEIKPIKANVDSILDGFVQDYGQIVSIDVDHVDLTFEVENEKIDTLKETFVRTLKRNKSKKIKIHALNDVSFQIYKGEKVGVIGYNGAGKSTLLGVITGIYPPDKGKVNTLGKISPLLSLGAGFDPNFSGRKNIVLNGAVLGYDKGFLESKVEEIIEFSELGEFIDIPIKNYSSGMLAKLGFSIATAVEPDILIIDEILGVGDVTFQRKCSDKIRSLMDGGTTVLLVSHSIPQIRNLCDKAIWIDKGRVRGIGEVNKVCDEYLKDSEKASNKQLENIKFR